VLFLQARVVLVMVDSTFHRSKECIEVCLRHILMIHPSFPPFFHLQILISIFSRALHTIDNLSRAASQKLDQEMTISISLRSSKSGPIHLKESPSSHSSCRGSKSKITATGKPSLLQPIVQIIPNFQKCRDRKQVSNR
jgi:hypothetical protein